MAETSPPALTASQSHALFDILSHRQLYSEIESFKLPSAINSYGPPFQTSSSSSTPVLQSLLSKFALTLPGLSQVKEEFWTKYVKSLVEELSSAELSESYDKGSLGIRKTIATALSALLEYPARGILGGLDRKDSKDGGKDEKAVEERKYDTKNADDILQAWHDCLQDIVYGDLIDRLFKKAAQTADLTDHESKVQGMHEYIIVNVASLIHYTLVLSPEGPALVRMIDNVHRLLPYAIMRQTLKVGNAATMISGMMRVMLAKVSVASVTNWMGWSAGADEGMNLMQQIISQVLGWDKRDLKKRAEKIERDPKLVPTEVKTELKSWIDRGRAEHEECRRQSQQQGASIVEVILSLSSVSAELTDEQHKNALEYLSLNLAVRDRTEIVKVLCNRNPDYLTAAVREGVDAYTPIIRNVHQAVDLSGAIWDYECFVTDMIKVAKPNAAKNQPPSVEDFVDLLHKHQGSSHKFLHQIAKNGPETLEWWRKYIHQAAAQFRNDKAGPSTEATISSKNSSNALRKTLQDIFGSLKEDDRKQVETELDAYDTYMKNLQAETAARIDAVVKRTGESPHGPGAYLARWQDLLDRTLITPASAHGPMRHGDSKSVEQESKKDVDGEEKGFAVTKKKREGLKPPSLEKTWEVFSPKFQATLRGQ